MPDQGANGEVGQSADADCKQENGACQIDHLSCYAVVDIPAVHGQDQAPVGVWEADVSHRQATLGIVDERPAIG